MELNKIIRTVADCTIREKYTIPDANFNFFAWEEGKGMYVTEEYAKVAKKFSRLDMMYDFFDWQSGVGFYSVIQAGKCLRDKKYINFVKEWIDFHLEKGLPPENINTTAPYLCMLELYQRTGDERYRAACAERADFLMASARRTNGGAFEHTAIGVNMRFSSQIWADTLFMGALFLAKWGAYTGNRMYCTEAVRQLLLHYYYLSDSNTGLLFHGYNCEERSHMSAVRWGRANGWGLLSSIGILEAVPSWIDGRDKALENFRAHLTSMTECREENGGFHTVLDCPSTYLETTVASAYLYAAYWAGTNGVVDPGRLSPETTLIYLCSQIASDGTVRGASGGTPIMRSVEEYNKIPCTMSYYGQGMALLALCAAQNKF